MLKIGLRVAGRLQYSIMKWITLKSKNLPIVALEIERALEVFTAITEKAQTSRSEQDIEQLDVLKRDLEKRINQLDSFYKQHYLQENISIFHMLRMKLERAVFISNRKMAKVETLSKKQSMFWVDQPLFKDGDIKVLDQPLFAYYEKSLKDNNSEIKKKLSNIKEDKNTFEITRNQKVTKPASNVAKQQKSTIQKLVKKDKDIKNVPPKVKPKDLITKEIIKAKAHQKQKQSEFNTANFGQKSKVSNLGNSNFKTQALNPSSLLQQMKKSSELTFTIKMTKQQYKSLLQIKSTLKDNPK